MQYFVCNKAGDVARIFYCKPSMAQLLEVFGDDHQGVTAQDIVDNLLGDQIQVFRRDDEKGFVTWTQMDEETEPGDFRAWVNLLLKHHPKEEGERDPEEVLQHFDKEINDPGSSLNKCSVIWMGTLHTLVEVVKAQKGMLIKMDFDDGGITDYGEDPQPHEVTVAFRTATKMARFIKIWQETYAP